jgi:hypothetical protein
MSKAHRPHNVQGDVSMATIWNYPKSALIKTLHNNMKSGDVDHFWHILPKSRIVWYIIHTLFHRYIEGVKYNDKKMGGLLF